MNNYYIEVGAKFILSDNIRDYDYKLEDLEYISINKQVVYGAIGCNYIPYSCRGETLILPIPKYHNVIFVDKSMKLYELIEKHFIITLNFDKFIDNLSRECHLAKVVPNNVYNINFKQVTFYESFLGFIKHTIDRGISEKDRNFNFITQEQLDNIDIIDLWTHFPQWTYNMFNDDNLYNYFAWYVMEYVV